MKKKVSLIIQLFLLFFPTVALAITTPVIVPYPHDIDGNYTISWSAASDLSGIASYELQEAVTTTEVMVDDAESGLTKWNSTFSISTEEVYSGNYSFYSGKGNYLYVTMDYNDPIYISGNETLTFWTKYDTELNYDYFYVQVSTDRSSWIDLDKLCGYQGTMVKKSYSLSAYVGQNIYLRFKYTTDSIIFNSGVYIDDIKIEKALDFYPVTGMLTATSYNFAGKTDGLYYYRVRARSNAGNWSAFSPVEPVSVGPDVYPPAAPVANSSAVSCAVGGTLTINWSTPTDESGIAAYEIREIEGELGTVLIDDGESGPSKWDMTGFSLGYYDSYLGGNVFQSTSGSNVNAILALKKAVNICGTETLKFSLYDLYGVGTLYIESSADKVAWQQLASFSGNTYWQGKSCSLGLVGGESVYLRFRFVTNGIYSSGIRINDIKIDGAPAATPKILSSSIVTTSYSVTPSTYGKYNYIIRAKDGAGNWSGFSSPVSVMAAASSGVDLLVGTDDIVLTPERCAEGDDMNIVVTVHNNGAQASNGTLQVYYNKKDSSHLVGSKFIALAPLSSASYLFPFQTFAKGSNPKIIAVAADYSSEADISNNEASKQAQVISLVRPTFCYPSPFNPEKEPTTIVYRLDQSENVQIIIFSSTGQIVSRRSISSGNDGGKIGLNEIKWNGLTDFGEVARNGVYIYKVLDSSKNVIFGGKVVVLR